MRTEASSVSAKSVRSHKAKEGVAMTKFLNAFKWNKAAAYGEKFSEHAEPVRSEARHPVSPW